MKWLNNGQQTNPRAHRTWTLLAILGFVSLILGLILYQNQMTEAGPLAHRYAEPLEKPRNGFLGGILGDYPPDDSDGDGIPNDVECRRAGSLNDKAISHYKQAIRLYTCQNRGAENSEYVRSWSNMIRELEMSAERAGVVDNNP